MSTYYASSSAETDYANHADIFPKYFKPAAAAATANIYFPSPGTEVATPPVMRQQPVVGAPPRTPAGTDQQSAFAPQIPPAPPSPPSPPRTPPPPPVPSYPATKLPRFFHGVVTVCGVIFLFVAVLSLVVCAVEHVFVSDPFASELRPEFIGVGYWAGGVYMIAGILAIASGKCRRKNLVVCLTVVCLVTCLVAVVQCVLGVVGCISLKNNYVQRQIHVGLSDINNIDIPLAMNAGSATLSVFAFVTSSVCLWASCTAVRRQSRHQRLMQQQRHLQPIYHITTSSPIRQPPFVAGGASISDADFSSYQQQLNPSSQPYSRELTADKKLESFTGAAFPRIYPTLSALRDPPEHQQPAADAMNPESGYHSSDANVNEYATLHHHQSNHHRATTPSRRDVVAFPVAVSARRRVHESTQFSSTSAVASSSDRNSTKDSRPNTAAAEPNGSSGKWRPVPPPRTCCSAGDGGPTAVMPSAPPFFQDKESFGDNELPSFSF